MGNLRPGGYDGLFWTAESASVAQTYIPATGAVVRASIFERDLNKSVWPKKHDLFYTLARQIGPAPLELSWDDFYMARSFRLPKGYATYGHVVDHIENVLGYTNQSAAGSGERGERVYELRTDGWNAAKDGYEIVAADFKKTGSLVIVSGHQQMRFFDMALGESDLTAVQYHSLGAFEQARARGYDGVVIDDFCQTKAWGNVAHRSIGFFDTALLRLSIEIIPACQFEWGGQSNDLAQTDTPEYTQWLRGQAAKEAAWRFSAKEAACKAGQPAGLGNGIT